MTQGYRDEEQGLEGIVQGFREDAQGLQMG